MSKEHGARIVRPLLSMIRGYHVYRDIWSSVLGEELPCQRETGNISDPIAVSVLKDGIDVIGHVPKRYPLFVHCFYREMDQLFAVFLVTEDFEKIYVNVVLKSHAL